MVFAKSLMASVRKPLEMETVESETLGEIYMVSQKNQYYRCGSLRTGEADSTGRDTVPPTTIATFV